MIDILIIIFLVYFGYIGYQKGFLRELNNMISYVFGLLLSRMMFSIFSDSLTLFILQDRLRDKVSYLISFIIIVYIFKTLTRFIENLIHLKWKNKLLGLSLGVLNGIIIVSLTISIFKEIVPNSFNLTKSWESQSVLYKNLDSFQKKYLIQYKENIK